MIVFDLQCHDGGETFEAWFGSNADFEAQCSGGLVQCPVCQSTNVAKAPMAPSVPRKGAGNPLAGVGVCKDKLLKNSGGGGDQSAEPARPIHSGEAEPEPVHGNATLEQA